jgi:hypothetical protein
MKYVVRIHSTSSDLPELLNEVIESAADALAFNDILEYRCLKNLGGNEKKRKSEGSFDSANHELVKQKMDISVPTKAFRSRSLLLDVRPCGQIISFTPLYK